MKIRIKDIMTCEPALIQPTETVLEAASRMKSVDCGVLPVGDADNVVGMITDRDITLRVTAEGRDPATTKVQEVMTKKVYTCDEDDDIEDAAEDMRRYNVARLVVTRKGKVTGIVTMAGLLRAGGNRKEGEKVLRELAGKESKRKVAALCD